MFELRSQRKHLVRGLLLAVGGLLLLVSKPAEADVLDARARMMASLERYGTFTVLGRWDGQPGGACALTGLAPKEPLFLVNDFGKIPAGIKIVGPSVILDTSIIAQQTLTFQNYGDAPSNAQAIFNKMVTKSLALQFSQTFSTSITGNLTLTLGVPGYASAAVGISGSKTWSTTDTTTQTTSTSVSMGGSDTAPVPPHSEIDVTYTIRSSRTQNTVEATGEFDAALYPCQAAPAGAKNASDLLSSAERTFTVRGTVDYDDVQEGTFTVSAARPIPANRLTLSRRRFMAKSSSSSKWESRAWDGKRYSPR